ncbi:MAG: hypothetical protein E7648_02815 [Ruminococcaceae bacterium]|nr:hypothetical protein [Oscillospiraceae bacterium]
MFKYGGNNNFCGRFDFFEWSAPYYETPKEVYKALEKTGVIGKKLVAINAIGSCNINSLGELYLYDTITAAGVELGDLWWEEYEKLDKVLVPWRFSMCEPIQFVFDDKTTLEIMPTQSGGARIGKNSIPAGLVNGLNHASINATDFFEELICKKLKDINIEIKSHQTEYINRYNVDDHKKYKETRKHYSIKFDFDYPFDLDITQAWTGWYGVGARDNYSDRIPYERVKRSTITHEYVEIVNGRDGGGTFWIVCANTNEKNKARVPSLDCFGISIYDGDVSQFLSEFLYRYFDPSVQKREEYDEEGFDWFGINLYTFDSIRRMISDIKRVQEMIQYDYDNSALDSIKSHWSVYRYTDKTKNDLTAEEINELRKRVVPVAVDFYERLCKRLEQMLDIPGNNVMSFAGP